MDLLEDTFEGVEGSDGLVDLAGELVEEPLFELEGLGVVPALSGLVPVGLEILEQGQQTILCAGHGEVEVGAGPGPGSTGRGGVVVSGGTSV